jgi:hypothetical protein
MIKAACVSLVCTATLIAAGGAVEGTVASGVDGTMLSGVVVTLSKSGQAADSYRAITDSTGTFRITSVSQGSYIPQFRKEGFLAPGSAGQNRPLLVAADSDVIRLQIVLPRMGRVAGKLVDPEGKPLEGFAVELQHSRGPGTNLAQTGAGGVFLFDSVIPGLYVLLARPGAHRWTSSGRLTFEKHNSSEAGPAEQAEWAPTYFPGLTDRRSAQVIRVEPNAEVSGNTLTMRGAPVRYIRGMVVDNRGRGIAGATVSAAPESGVTEATLVTAPDGSFEIGHLRDDSWRLEASAEVAGAHWRGTASAMVAGRNLDKVVIPLTRPFVFMSTAEFEKPAGATRDQGSVRVSLVPSGDDLALAATEDAHGTVWIPAVGAGRYAIVPTAFVPGYYLAAVELNGRDVLGQEVELNETSAAARILYRSNPGRIAGRVEKGEGKIVVVLPCAERLRDYRFIRSVSAVSGGEFRVDGLAPGDYAVVAVDSLDPEALRDPTVVQWLMSNGTRVRLEQGLERRVEISAAVAMPF